MEKRILCFGDSNTWGLITGKKPKRLLERFPKILQKLLGSEFEIIEEGLYSRTLISEDRRPNREGRNGSTYLIPCLDSHDPLDIIILMLGTNELKETFQKTPVQIGDMIERHFVNVIMNRQQLIKKERPYLIIISPPIIDESTTWASRNYSGGTQKSKQLSQIYSKIAKRNECFFIDGSGLEVGEDGVHMTKESHRKLATMIKDTIDKIEF